MLNDQQTINKTRILESLKRILSKLDGEWEEVLPNRKLSKKHIDEIELLLSHIAIGVEYILLDNQATRNELFHLKSLLEDNNGEQYGEL